jgi:hypothetical protein
MGNPAKGHPGSSTINKYRTPRLKRLSPLAGRLAKTPTPPIVTMSQTAWLGLFPFLCNFDNAKTVNTIACTGIIVHLVLKVFVCYQLKAQWGQLAGLQAEKERV